MADFLRARRGDVPNGQRGSGRGAYAGGLLLAAAVLVAAGLWLGKRDAGAPVGALSEPEAKAEWTPADFGGFAAGMGIGEVMAFAWDEVPPFRMDAEWRGLEASEEEKSGLGEIDGEGAPEAATGFSRDENWREPAGLFFRPDIDPRVIRYKIDPSFGFENRERLLKGMMIRVQVSF